MGGTPEGTTEEQAKPMHLGNNNLPVLDDYGKIMKNDEIGERLRRIEELLAAQQPRPLTLPEAAAYLSISKSRMYAYTSKSLIPHFKPNGKKIVFKKADLDAFLYRNRVASVEEIEREV